MHKLIKEAKEAGRSLLENEANSLLKEFSLPVIDCYLTRAPEEAVAAADELGYPVVLKVVSSQIIHKSEAGGVKLNLKTAEEVQKAYQEIIQNAKAYNPKAQVEGVLVTPYLSDGTEVIIGMTTDPQFGPVMMFGLGGIFVEVFKDVSFKLAPLSIEEAREMIKNVKGYTILQGVRGQKAKYTEGLADALVKLSQLVTANPEIKEIDLNPVVVFEDSIAILDARILL